MAMPCKAVTLNDGKLIETNVPCLGYAFKAGNQVVSGTSWTTITQFVQRKVHPVVDVFLSPFTVRFNRGGWYTIELHVTIDETYNFTPDGEARIIGFDVTPDPSTSGMSNTYTQNSEREPVYMVTAPALLIPEGGEYLAQFRNFGGSPETILGAKTGLKITGPWE